MLKKAFQSLKTKNAFILFFAPNYIFIFGPIPVTSSGQTLLCNIQFKETK